ncbi:MAG: SsrA-binding protein [Candidatus Omnitrophota bacterium]|jgi:SsrA-binding protein
MTTDKPKNKPKDKPKNTTIATNRQAGRSYEFLEKMEAGMKLVGTEIKSLRAGKCQLHEGFARFEKNELFLYNVYIDAYEQGNIHNHEPTRIRKLLMRKSELKKLFGKMTQKGLTIIPTAVYIKHGIAKCEIALAKPKKLHDNRAEVKKRGTDREIARTIKSFNQR